MTRRKSRLAAALAVASVAVAPFAATGQVRVLDDFADTSAWTATASDEVKAEAVRAPDGALCLRYDFGRVSGYAVLRRALAIELPPHFALTLTLRGNGPPNALQVKLVDATGDNVWWFHRPGWVAPERSSELVIRQRQIEFAWGPTNDRTLRRAAAVELVVASGTGGRGELCFERLALRELPPPAPPTPPVASASTARAQAALALDGDAATAWRGGWGPAPPAPPRGGGGPPGAAGGGGAAGAGRGGRGGGRAAPAARGGRARPGAQHWQLDFGAPRELNGVLVRWADGARASDFDLQFSDDGRAWRTVRRVRGSARDVLPLWLPDSEARHLRLALRGGPHAAGYALAEIKPMSPAEWPTLNAALATLAQELPRGRMPRAWLGQQNYWTLVGVDRGAADSALVSEDGAIEPRRAGPSLEPFVVEESGRISGWADAVAEHALRNNHLPLPQARFVAPRHTLAVEVGAEGTPERAQLIARYTLTNTAAQRRTLTLALGLRPWQVNPPQQFLNTAGGVAPVRSIEWQREAAGGRGGGVLRVDGRDWLHTMSPPNAVTAAAFDQGDPLELASLPPLTRLDDAQALASAVLRWRIELAPGASRSVYVVLPLAGAASLPADPRVALDAVAHGWQQRLGRVTLALPPAARPLADALRSALAHILMSRDGAALQPGTRSYARAWVRDGAMMVAGLLRLGEVEPAREFVQWYAQQLFANGKVPCCVDARGADPVAENDSHGQFIHMVALLWSHTRDTKLIDPLWPKVDAAARYMEQLRQSQRTPAQQGTPYWGLMPASISHEGYSAKPMHSYWDDFWALAGYRDAARLAQIFGPTARAAGLARQRDEFGNDLAASLAAAVAQHRIAFLPGAAELGDFDPSSSTMIFSPAGFENRVPRALLESTWERYWREAVARRDGRRAWTDYTPYELRSVSAFVRLGQPERALALLDHFLRDRRPAGWNQWAEVVGREPREPRFVGDMPHAWISSDYIRSVLDLLAYERESDGALVIGAGVPASWWASGPVEVRGLRTPWGPLAWRLQRDAGRVLHLSVAPGLEPPPGGVWFAWTGRGAPPAATVDGALLAWQGKLLRLPQGAVELRMTLAAGTR